MKRRQSPSGPILAKGGSAIMLQRGQPLEK
jgi:hypothetical protein